MKSKFSRFIKNRLSFFVISTILFCSTAFAFSLTNAGTLDNTFGTGGTVISQNGNNWSVISAVAIQPDNKIIAGGYSNTGDQDFLLMRFLFDGSLDNSFGIQGKVSTKIRSFADDILSIAIQPDGKILAAGSSSTGPSPQFDPFDIAIVRYNRNGTIDNSFGNNGIVITSVGTGSYSSAKSIKLFKTGKFIVVASGFAVKYTSNGTLDTGFGVGGIVKLSDLTNVPVLANELELSDNKIIIGGRGGAAFNDFVLVKLRSNGSLDSTFGINGTVTTSFPNGTSAEINSLVLHNGKIIAAGGVYSATDYDFAIAKYKSNGSLDNTFGTNGKVTTSFSASRDIATSMVIQGNNKIIVSGTSRYNGSNDAFALARYDYNGLLDNSFGTAGKVTTVISSSSFSNASIMQTNGKIVLAGASYTNPNFNVTLARYNAD
jgi:uncharacterized delta-60 repeat protein